MSKNTSSKNKNITYKSLSYGKFERESLLHERVVSYNLLTPKPEYDAQAKLIPHRPQNIRPKLLDLGRLLGPYIGTRAADQLRAVIPLALYLFLFQLIVLKQNITDAQSVLLGILAVITGLMLFMEGLQLGLMPFSNVIGSQLPKKLSLGFVLLIALVLGVGVTFAEPAIGALQAVGSIISAQEAPYLYGLLNLWANWLVLAVGIGVGLAAVAGTMRLLFHWSLKPFIYAALLPVMALTLYCALDDDLLYIVGLAWDCGAVTTGPVTVPLVLSLGIGISSTQGKGGSALSGFGIVTLASLFPILAVLILGIGFSFLYSPEEVLMLVASQSTISIQETWLNQTPFGEIKQAAQAIIPLILFLFFILKWVLKEKISDKVTLYYGLFLCLAGMAVFNIGLSYGLAALGAQAGALVPSAFLELPSVTQSPLYSTFLGIIIAVAFAWILGLGTTIAEPALNAMGITVEAITNGAFRKKLLIWVVSFGVACGIAVGVLKIIFDLPLVWLLLGGYSIAIILTLLSSEEFVNVAWDSAGVTTGPVTVPLVLAMGVGLGEALNAKEGFGILSMASIFPIISVLATGLLIRYMRYRRHQKRDEEHETIPAQ